MGRRRLLLVQMSLVWILSRTLHELLLWWSVNLSRIIDCMCGNSSLTVTHAALIDAIEFMTVQLARMRRRNRCFPRVNWALPVTWVRLCGKVRCCLLPVLIRHLWVFWYSLHLRHLRHLRCRLIVTLCLWQLMSHLILWRLWLLLYLVLLFKHLLVWLRCNVKLWMKLLLVRQRCNMLHGYFRIFKFMREIIRKLSEKFKW